MLLDLLSLLDGSAHAPPPTVETRAHWGNALGVVFTEPTFIETARCVCVKGKAPIKACEVHCQVVYRRQAIEEELVTLSLV